MKRVLAGADERPVAAGKVGRPPRLSRQAILKAALTLLQHAPREPITAARIASQVDAVPAALYRHFANLDELLDGVLAMVLDQVEIKIRRRAAWPTQIRDWMTSVRSHLLGYPAVLRLLGRRGRTSPAWLDAVAAPIAILSAAGLRDVELARAHLWLTETTIALVIQEATLSFHDQLRGARASLKEMSPEGRASLAPLLAHLAKQDPDQMFEFMAERTIAALVDLIERR